MPLNYHQVCKKLKKLGFCFFRNAKGAHEVWKNSEGKTIILSNHGKFNIPKGTLSQIAKNAGSRNLNEFRNL